MAEYATHDTPIWAESADFIINAPILTRSSGPEFEQLYTRRVSENQFEICCIPFFIYDVALGDVVATSPAGHLQFVLKSVIEAAGRYVFRVWFGESSGSRDLVAAQISDLNGLLEWSSRNLLAVDAADARIARTIASLLANKEADGQLVYETGRTA